MIFLRGETLKESCSKGSVEIRESNTRRQLKSEFDKKAYDAAHQRKLYVVYRQQRDDLEEQLGNVCYLCKQGKRNCFHLHHREYHPTESNYPRHSNAMSVRRKRLKEAQAHPERFALLCPTCHRLITALEFGDIDRERLKELIG